MDALRRANEVRKWLAEQRNTVHRGDIDLWDRLCQSGDERLKSVTVLEFLQWLPGIGVHRARTIIGEQFIWPSARSEARRVSTLDHDTALRLCAAVRRARSPAGRVTA